MLYRLSSEHPRQCDGSAFPQAGMVIGLATTRRCWAILSHSTSRCGGTCVRRYGYQRLVAGQVCPATASPAAQTTGCQQGEWRVQQQHEEAMSLTTEKPIHPNYFAAVASRVPQKRRLWCQENFRSADHLLPFGFNKGQWRLIRTYGGSLGYGIGAAIGTQLGAPDRPVFTVWATVRSLAKPPASGQWPVIVCRS